MSAYRVAVACVLLTSLCSCASAELTANTVDVASSVQSNYKRQVLTNLSRTIDDPWAIPSQVDLSAGTIQTADSVTPSISTPLSRSITRGGSGVISGFTTAAVSASASASDSRTQNWNVAPVNDANTLRNLRSLYRYVVWGTNLRVEYHQPRMAKGNGTFPIDPYSELYPQCVLCMTTMKVVENPKTHKRQAVTALEPNASLHGGWLYWNGGGANGIAHLPPPGSKIIDLGHYGNHELYMRTRDWYAGYLTNFILFLLPNAEPTAQQKAGAVGGAIQRNNSVLVVPQQIIPPTQ